MGETVEDKVRDASRDELVDELRDRVRALEEANRENRRIIAALTSRIPQLEAPRDERDARETALEDDSGTETPAGDTGEPRGRSWWRRFFGFG
jgi:predicted phage gp36 major capsid-like protein